MTVLRHPARRFARLACGLLGALILAGIVLAATAPAASAHATLLFTSPAADSAVPVPPEAITLTFNEQVTLAGTPVALAGPGEREIPLGAARESGGRSVVTVPVASRLPDGVYKVSWQVISSDGDPINSQYEFAIGPVPAALGSLAVSATPSTPGQWPLAAARWLLFSGLAAALGGLAGQRLARVYRHPPPVPLPGPWALRGSLLGLAAGVVLAALQLGGGSLPAGLGHLSLPKLLSSGPGVIVAVEVASFAAAAVLLRLRRPRWSVLPLLAVAAAEGLRAHPENVIPTWGAMLTWAHLLSAALWAGMLLYVVRAAIAWRAHPTAVRALVRLYSRAAAWLFALVVVTGGLSALVLVPLGSLFTTDYGRVLIVKASLVGAAAALALAGRRWLRRSPAAGAGPALATRIETGALASVLAVTALLSTIAAPSLARSGGGALPFPPPASGLLVPLGGRAGEVGIYATASAGQIVPHLAVPQENGTPSPRLTVSMTLAGPNGATSTPAVRGCGQGCFVAPARWARGDNLLTLGVTATGWTGGTASLDVPWPPAAGMSLLRRALAAMRQVRKMTVYEQVTSDTALGNGAMNAIPVSGPAFLGVEPYAGGVAPVADLVTGGGGQQVLLLGFPDAGTWAELTIGAHNRFTHEILDDPGHLVSRGFAYPGK